MSLVKEVRIFSFLTDTVPMKMNAPVYSVVAPEPPFLAGAVKKEAAPAPALTLCLKKRNKQNF